MFNLNSTLDVGFANPIAPASISMTYPASGVQGIGGQFTDAAQPFFTIQEAGNIVPTILRFSAGAANSASEQVTTSTSAILNFEIFAFQNLGINAVSRLVSIINTIPTEGVGRLTIGIGGAGASRILRNCVASASGSGETLVLTQINSSITNITFTPDELSTVTGTVTNGVADFTNTQFTDHRIEMASFSDNRTYTSTQDNSIQVRFTKALNSIFVYLPNPSPLEHQIIQMTATKPDGTEIPFVDFVDGTFGFSQSGFIYWRPEYDKYDNFQRDEKYTYNFRTDSAITATFGGINLLFCDKFDLLREYPDLDSLLGISDDKIITSQLIRIMESTMLEIEKKVQNSPFWKEDRQYFFTAKQLDRWDLLQINEINQAAIFWTLAKILYFLSDTPGDIYSAKAADYRARGETAFESVNLSLDFNDNGSLDVFEGEREAANIEITFER